MKSSLIITLITYTMAAMGLVSASLVTEVGPGFLITAVAIVILSLVKRVLTESGNHSDPARTTRLKTIWNIAAIGLFLFFTLDYLMLSHNLMGSAARFLTILAAIKLFDLNETRDYLIFYSLTFFEIIAAAASTISPIFLLIISLFIICAIWAMIIFNIKGEFESHYPGQKDLPSNIFSPAFFLTTIALTIVSITITLILFFIIPRVGIGLFDTKNISGIKVSGFSEKIRLGDFGPVKRDTAVVMRVELVGGPPLNETLYFRGQTLDRYVPTGWEATTRKKTRLWKKSDNRFIIGRTQKIGTSMLVQKIMLEALETDVIFGASRIVMVEGRFPTLWTNESGAIYLPNIPYSRIEYTVMSNLDSAVLEDPNDGTLYYLETEELSAEVVELARRLTRGSRTKTEKVEKIKTFLKQNYSYTLSPRKGEGPSPLDDFLFFTKEGYCEHFATAMAMLLRGAGIPARIVTGFLQGEWNEYGNYLLVRQQDAHSWVEADIDGWWTRFDPTPSIGLTGLVKTSALSMYVDALRFKWRRYIIKYSISDQVRAALKIENQTNLVINGIRSYINAVRDIVTKGDATSLRSLLRPSSFIMIFAIIIMIILALFFRSQSRSRKEGAVRKKTPPFYRRMEIYLKKAGLERNYGETAMEFAKRIGNKDALGITRAFEGVRYGHAKLSAKEIQKIEKALMNLKLAKESG